MGEVPSATDPSCSVPAITAHPMLTTRDENAMRMSGVQTPQTFGSIPAALSASPFRDDVYMSYTMTNLVPGRPLFQLYGDLVRISPVQSVLQKLVRNAFLALSALLFGLRHREKAIQVEGMQLYGKVLTEIGCLHGQDRADSTELMASLTSICIFEVLIVL